MPIGKQGGQQVSRMVARRQSVGEGEDAREYTKGGVMPQFKSLGVGVRLGVAFAVVIALLLVVSLTAFVKIRTINATIDKITDERYIKVRLAYDVRDGVNEQIKYLRGIVIDIGNQEGNEKRFGQLAAAVRKTAETISRLAKAESDADGRKYIGNLQTLHEQFDKQSGALIVLVKANNVADSKEYVLRKITNAQVAYLDAATAYANEQDRLLQQEGDAALAEGALAINVTLACSAFAVLVAVILGYLITRSIVQPLQTAVHIAENVAGGDLITAIDVVSSDETGMLMASLKKMNENLKSIVGDVRGGAECIAAASKEISSGNLELSARTEQQAGALEETASAMDEMTSTVKQNADNARQANQMAASASAIAVEGGEVVAQVVKTMNSINESSRRIVDIIGVIDGIAFQTNILALNAAVEAARAGEQGRGFAVVASEVRSLAQRSAAAAKEIKQLIDNSVSEVHGGTQLVDQAGVTMQKVVDSVKRVSDIVGEISAASSEQSTGIEEINRAVTQMDTVTQQNAALVEEAAAAAQAMQTQAQRLTNAINIFKLDDAGPIPVVTNSAPPRAATTRTTTSAASRPVARLARPVSVVPTAASIASTPKTPEKTSGDGDSWETF